MVGSINSHLIIMHKHGDEYDSLLLYIIKYLMVLSLRHWEYRG